LLWRITVLNAPTFISFNVYQLETSVYQYENFAFAFASNYSSAIIRSATHPIDEGRLNPIDFDLESVSKPLFSCGRFVLLEHQKC
jgi:hypothetical protein